MKKLIKWSSYIMGILFSISIMIIVIGATYDIPESSLLMRVFKPTYVITVASFLIWAAILIVSLFKEED